MVRKAEFECPCCGGPLRAWYQSQVATVVCLACHREIDIPEPGLFAIAEPQHAGILDKLHLLMQGVFSW